ncbi:DUF5722 domain-containing protein [Planctomycetes bacterium K23_9]|uniref:DUF5722 domain-containing protein n=1 Tax=Stieleria marina TaxID=1930275 RepID=A0A517P2F9_9BACT|nr:hypothetical protein K239x_55820 [Planctomycetes bacterium K23_9]
MFRTHWFQTFCLLSVVMIMTPRAVAVDWLVSRDRNNDVVIGSLPATTPATSEVNIRTTGSDPFVVGRLSAPMTADEPVLQFDYFSTSGIRHFSVVLGPPLNESRRIDLPSLIIAEGWQTYTVDLASVKGSALPTDVTELRFDFGSTKNCDIQLRDVQLRRLTEQEARANEAALARQASQRRQVNAIDDYLKAQPPKMIESIAVQNDQIAITLKPEFASLQDDLELLEYRTCESVDDSGKAAVFRQVGQRLLVPRRQGGQDRIGSSWRIRSTKTDQVTARQFPTTIATLRRDHAASRLIPSNQKGLTGLSQRGLEQDFVDLGVKSVTINFQLSRFVSDRPGPNRVKMDVPGEPVFFDTAGFSAYDQQMHFAQIHEMVVSAIILVPQSKKPSARSVLAHPQADGGAYAMPDLTTPRGAAVYQFVIDKIAGRYRNHERDRGEITNWIAHNEIDFHAVWTNMGKQPRELVAETYYRSMRLIDCVAKQHNPHARVFASLTHHWNDASPDDWQRFSARWLLETLQQFSRIEGDFDWGVAYHPYPQSLLAKVPWNDKRITDQFDTPLMTMQNLDVLGRFLQQPSMLQSNGQMRGVILSEQGFHSHSYETEDQDAQAAALYWAMQQVQKMPWIESFIYHRWIDHPQEGGLRLGLRTLPDQANRHGKKKRSWQIFQTIGTSYETEAAKGLTLPKD